jgi:hypothetical protein
VLEQDRGGEGVDISFPAPRRAAHLTNGALRRGGREPLVDQPHRQAASFAKEGRHATGLSTSLRFVAFLV